MTATIKNATSIDTAIQDALSGDQWTSATDLYLEVLENISVATAMETLIRRAPRTVGTAEELIATGRKMFLQVVIARQVYYGNIERQGRGENSSYRLAL